MKIKSIVIVLALSFGFILQAHARPEMTEEQLVKAREVAAQMKTPIDFDLMLDEADRLGVECEGDLTRKIKIATCSKKVENAQTKERIVQNINRAGDMADEMLNRQE